MSIMCPHGETTCANCYYCAVNKDRDATIARLQAEASSLQEQLRLARVARDSFESAMSANDAKGITPWRVGRKALRTLYDANDRLVGVVDTPDMATLVVEAVNAYWGTGVEPKVYPHAAPPSPETGAPTRRDCNTCGEGVAFDEDGCCSQCGSDTVLMRYAPAAPAAEPGKPPASVFCDQFEEDIPGFGTNRDTHRCAKAHRSRRATPEKGGRG